MKVMEVTIEDKDRSIEIVTPPRKKMKQAQLPFQMVSPLGSAGTTPNKKRKFESPSPVENQSPRTGRGIRKQNAAKRAKGIEAEIVEICEVESGDDSVGRETNKLMTVQDGKNRNESGKDITADKCDEKFEKTSETDGKKRKEYNMLEAFLKKAQSKEAKDDNQLLTMSDYDGSSKNKLDTASLKSAGEVSSLKESNNETEEENNSTSHNDECQISVEPDECSELKTGDEVDKAEDLETKISDTDVDSIVKDCINSDDNDVRNVDSDSDIGVLSSSDDPDDEPDKSSNENVEKDQTLEESDGIKTPRDEKSNSLKHRKLTPKQNERRLKSAKKREEKLRLKKEREKKREEEREIRRKEKEERRKEKEEKEKVEREQKRKEKEMKEMKKQMETEQKQKEKEAKEEERRKREEEKLEAERKKQKAASNFANFFVAKKQGSKTAEEDNVVKGQNFMPFEVKVDMRVAPITRRKLSNESKLTFEGLFNKDLPPSTLYLDELKQNSRPIGRSKKTWPYEAKDDVVIVDEEDGSEAVDQSSSVITEKHRPKMFLFIENRRPPFWGTWRKKSSHINARKPFARDSKWFDYDVDSDDEWEEEEPGESLRGSDDERDDEGPEENEYDVDNDFMVPHGYLSDEEAKADEEDGEDMSPETQKLKLKLLGEQFEAERKTKTSKIKPKVIGCVWQGSVNAYPENTAPNVVQILKAREAWVREIPIVLTTSLSVSENLPPNTTDCASPATPTMGPKKKRVPEEAMPNLIRLVHGNINGRIFLIKEFIAFWEKNKTGDRQISKLSLSQKIKEIASWIACPEEGPMHLRSCWYVREDVRKEYNCDEITLPNRWEYTLRPTRRSDLTEVVDKPEKIEKEKKRIPLITQFTKKITQEEMQKQLVSKPTTSISKPPKRATLISVPRGEQFQQSSRNNLLSKFVTCGDSKTPENRDNQPSGDQQLPVTETSAKEIHDICDSEKEKLDDTNEQARNEDEDSPEADQNVVRKEDEGAAEGESLPSDDKKVNEIESETRNVEPMETEDDNMIVLDD